MRLLEKWAIGSLATLTLCCGATTEADGDTAGNAAANTGGGNSSGGPGGSTAAGPPGSGEIQSPELPIEGDENIVILGSTLGRNADGQIRWAFTFRNDASEPTCHILLNAAVLDSSGAMLAGASVFSAEFAAGAPAFTGVAMGSLYSGHSADGVTFLDSCVPPGGRGLGFAEVFTLSGLQSEQVDAILASAATLRHDLTPTPSNLGELQPAPDLPRLKDLELVDTPDGKLVRGVALSSADLAAWYAWVALYDADGMIVDVVRGPAKSIETLKDTPIEFSFAPTLAAPTRFEVFFEESRLRH
ncbi:MAG TPA: hypothetical protein VI197_15600 [Polyangiaceae bacterium]